MPRIKLFYSSELARFNFGPGHPFTGDRFASFIELLGKAGLDDGMDLIPPRPASDEELQLAHSVDYIAHVRYLEKIGGALSIDTPVTRDALDIQTLVTGSGLQASALLLGGEADIAHTFGGFHHAGRDYGEGFCLFNDVAVTARALIDRHGLDRILILDTDAHQGNGTMDIFYDEPKVLFISIHQDPRTLYPGRGFVEEAGSGTGEGFTVNVPMPPFSGQRQYERAFDEIIDPIVKEFQPQFIIRNGGSDPYHGDDLTALGLDLGGLHMLGERTRRMADRSGAKLLDMMVSGYGRYVIFGWLAMFCGIENLDVDYLALSPEEPTRFSRLSEGALDTATEDVITKLKEVHRDFWNSL